MRSSRFPAVRPDPGDAAFIAEAASATLLVMEICELAAQRDAPAPLRRHAEELLSLHARSEEGLRTLGRRIGAEVPVALAADDQLAVTELNEAPSQELTERCLQRLMECHERLIDACEDARVHSRDGDVRAFAARLLPRLRAHLEQATRLNEVYSPRRAGTA